MTEAPIVQSGSRQKTMTSASHSQAAAGTADLARGDPQTIKPPQAPNDPKLRVRQAVLHGPILATMLKLAWPTILVLVAQVAVGVAETFYVSFLGTSALAGVALVFPILMLMTMMSNGAVGGGVASAMARAIGGGRRHDADALVLHALVIAVFFGLVFTAVTVLLGPAI